MKNNDSRISRRSLNRQMIGASTMSLLTSPSLGLQSGTKKAEACILIWLGGGMCHLDTFDPKQLGDPKQNKPGSAYQSIPTAISGVRVCEHLKRTAPLLDRGVLVRSMNHPLKVDHADSTNLVKTGRITSGTVIYPSLGALVSHERGPRENNIPPYVVMGYPNITRGPGFLGSKYSYVYLTNLESGPVGLSRPVDITTTRQKRRYELLGTLRQEFLSRYPEDRIRNYDDAVEQAIQLTQGSFPNVFSLDSESTRTREAYGSDFGQRCLLARRLVESGVRFVEVSFNMNFVNGTGWDTHRHGQEKQHVIINDLDQALSALVEDLEQRKQLDSTLVVLATEFGRPAEFDGQGGRGHQSSAFTVAMFGGGIKSGQVVGTTDELGKEIVDQPVSVPDLHATILSTLGINPHKELYADDRPVPVTDHGTPIPNL